MDTCTVEVGLLKKKPCGEASVTRCANCEQPLCSKHAVPEMTGAGRKSGKFLCKDCSVAAREYAKTVGDAPPVAKPKPPAAPAPAAAAPTAAPKAPAAPPATKPAAPAVKEPPADEKSGPNYGAIDFTPTKKP